MKIYDISQEVFGCTVYPGDPIPRRETLSSIDDGAAYNLTAFSMCAHNGTHIDAPLHFLPGGKGVDALPLSKYVGYAYVATVQEDIGEEQAERIFQKAFAAHPSAAERILLKGDAVLTTAGARFFAQKNVQLLGVESQSVGSIDAPMDVHVILLKNETVLLEGLRLKAVPDGAYLLHAAPLLLANSDGAPCRATLIALLDSETFK